MKHLNKLCISKSVAEALESIRHEIQLSKKEFSSLGKISPSYYSDIINNKRTPTLETLQKICDNIKIPLYVLLFKAINENPNESIEKKKLTREIKPYLDKITQIIYEDKINSTSSVNPIISNLSNSRFISCESDNDYFNENSKRKTIDFFEKC